MLPQLEAQETLSAIQTAALAAGGGEPLDRARIFAELERKANGEARTKVASSDDLVGMGIGLQDEQGDAQVIASLDDWLGVSRSPASDAAEKALRPSSDAASGEQERG